MRVLRGVLLFIAAVQVVALVSALGWISNPPADAGHALAILLIKAVACVLAAAAGEALRRLINRRRAARAPPLPPLSLFQL